MCLNRTQEHNILCGVLKDCRVLPKSNKTSSYIDDHSEDSLVYQETHVCLNHAQEHRHLPIVSIKEGK